MMHYTKTLKQSVFITSLALCWCNGSWATNIGTLDQALDNVSGMGTSTVSIAGDLNSSCSTGGSNTICIGTYVWTDDHANDASVNKGAMVLNGNVQQNLVTNINVNTTVSPTATGVNTIGTVDLPVPGTTLNLSNNNNATGFIGGF